MDYIEVERSDIALANRLAHEILGRTLDEMPPQKRKLLVLIQKMVKEQTGVQSCLANEVRFTRRDIREFTHWSDSQLKNHCLRLVEMEYLLVHGGSRGHLLQYQLLYDGNEPKGVHLCGLLDVENTVDNEGGESKSGTDECKSNLEERKSPPSLGQVRVKFGSENSPLVLMEKGIQGTQVWVDENTVIREIKNPPSLAAALSQENHHQEINHGIA